MSQLGLTCFAASVDRTEVSRAFAEWTGTSLPLLSDEDGEVARDYGILDEEQRTAARCTFFIGRDGRILAIDREISPSSAANDIRVKAQGLGMTA